MGKNLDRKRVVIVGGGFGGLHTAMSLKRANVDVLLIDRHNYHLFQPLLYQVATGGLSPANIAAPIRSILRRQKNASVMLAEVVNVDVNERAVEVRVSEPGENSIRIRRVSYDWLVVAAGSTHSYFGHNDWEQDAPGLKSIEDAMEIRGRVFSAFEAAEQETDPERRQALMTFVIAGGGPTGVELAGAIAELSRHTLRYDFRNINPSDAQIILVDGQGRMLATFTPELSQKAEDSLAKLGVQFRKKTFVTSVHPDRVELASGESTTTIPTRTIIWAAGVTGVPLGKALANAASLTIDRGGRVPVGPDLSLAGHSEIFVIGDLASCPGDDGKPLPGVAQVAIQQGRYVGRRIAASMRGQNVGAPFQYRDKGSMATIGRRAAVADLGRFKFTGFTAWFLWLVVHIMTLVQFQNRVLVLFQWAWNYFTFNRSARLITNRESEKSNSTR